MDSPGDPMPSQAEDTDRGFPRQYSTSRVDSRPQLVDRIPINPKIIAFESTQQRFEVPLRPEQWPSFAAGDGHMPPLQQPPNQPDRRKSNVPDASTSGFMDDDHPRVRKKPIRRKRNVSDDRTGDGSRRRKKLPSSNRSSKETNIAPDQSRRLTDYFPAKEGTQFMRSSRTSRGAADVGPVCVDDISTIPPLRIPRMRDLLSQHLGYLTGRPLHRFHELFDQFDRSFSDNINAIQSSLSNIVRAPFLLAERCRPVIEEVIAAQRSLFDTNNIGESSRMNNQGDENDTVGAHNVFDPGTSATRIPYTPIRNDITREDSRENSSPAPALARSSSRPPSSAFHQEARGEGNARKGTASDVLQSSSRSHDTNHYMDDPNSLPPDTHSEEDDSPSHTVAQYNNPKQRAGNRFTRKPARFCSPFKAGIMSRPPPNVEAARNLWEHLCADDSPLRSTTVIQFGTTPMNGAFIAQSFVDAAFPDSIFMSGFVKCITYDDYFIRPECHGYRIFFGPDLSAILNVEWSKRDSGETQYSEPAAVAAIQRCLPFTNLKMTKMIMLPVHHNHHWCVYCVNFGQNRIDVLDPIDHLSNGDNSWELYHSDMGKKIMQRLNDALSNVAPHKFKSFMNWRHVQVQVPVHNSSSDSAFYAMKFLEYYDGDGRGSLKTRIDVDSPKELRAEILYYLTFHSENKIAALPHDLSQFRLSDYHPFFY